MNESPASALRQKKHSSIRVAVDLVKAGEAEAVVSAGNTGASMATAKFVLRSIEGIERPAIASIMPSVHRNHPFVLPGRRGKHRLQTPLPFSVCLNG